jgi:cytoskeletal protein CcmA (bactofilin family)
MKLKILVLLIISLFGIAFVTPVRAFEMRNGDSVTVAKDTVIKGTLFAGGNTVTVDGTVTGDLFCGGNTITVNGTVTGDVICAGQTITVRGIVGGNIRAAGQLIDIAGTVSRNILLAGQTINIEPVAIISGDGITAGQSITLDGPIGPGLIAAAQTIRMNDAINGNVTAYTQNLSLGEKAHITGDLTYTSPATLNQSTGAAVIGKVTHHLPEKQNIKKPAVFTPGMFRPKPWPQNVFGSLAFYLIIGAIMVLIAPKKSLMIKTQMMELPFMNGLIGFVTLMLSPIIIIMFGITIIGIPVAILLIFVFIFLILLSRVAAAVIIGDKILEAFGQNKTSLLAQVAVGIVLIEFVVKVPLIGFVIGLIALLWGMGGIIMSFGKRARKK